VRGGAHAPHRVQACITYIKGRPSRELYVLCGTTLPGGNYCSSLASRPDGNRLTLADAESSHLDAVCCLHGGGRRCSHCSGVVRRGSQAWWQRQEQLTSVAVPLASRELCVACAESDGSKVIRRSGASMEAAGFFKMLAEVGGGTPEHERWDVQTGAWVGKEVDGLVSPWRDRPDGVERDEAGHVKRCWFYHGNHVHGYPPGHPLHGSMLSRTHQLSSVAWAQTVASMQRFVDAGYEVRYVCSYEYEAFWRVAVARRRSPDELMSIVHSM